MPSEFLNKLIQVFKKTPQDPQTKEYLQYLKSSYPNNHNYKIKNKRLIPSRELAKRYRRIHDLLPDPLTSLVDIGSSKGFFIFASAENSDCKRCLGIDVYQHDINVCRWLKAYLHNDKVAFELMHLHELAERIDEFGGPFQTVLILNIYQYLYFGSVRCPDGYLDHDKIFKYLRKICSERIIFNNRTELKDCQNIEQINLASEYSQNYSEEKILAAAAKYFNVVSHGKIGQYSLWAMDVKEEITASTMMELQAIFEACIIDPEFREKLKQNPEKALQDAGLHFDATTLQKIKMLLKQQETKLKSEELDKRLSR